MQWCRQVLFTVKKGDSFKSIKIKLLNKVLLETVMRRWGDQVREDTHMTVEAEWLQLNISKGKVLL
jgi:hypothetical protein